MSLRRINLIELSVSGWLQLYGGAGWSGKGLWIYAKDEMVVRVQDCCY